MKVNVYTMYDEAAKAYTQPFFAQHDGLALRMFEDMVNSDKPNNVSEHPDQFTLFSIGTWDDVEAKLEQETVKSLGNGLQYKKLSEKESLEVKIDQLMKTLKEK
jgi:hypothetical protein